MLPLTAPPLVEDHGVENPNQRPGQGGISDLRWRWVSRQPSVPAIRAAGRRWR